MSGSMSGDGKRGVGHWPQATAPILDSTTAHRPSVALAATGTTTQRVYRRQIPLEPPVPWVSPFRDFVHWRRPPLGVTAVPTAGIHKPSQIR
jgi:hypothetical protein